MKRSLFILAFLAMYSASYAQADDAFYTREQVLDIFSQYNPSALEKARQDEGYQQILEAFLSSYPHQPSPEEEFELLAAVRNFDNSILLQSLSQSYRQALLTARMTGHSLERLRPSYRKEFIHVTGRIWAVTLQVREFQRQEYKRQIRETRRDKTLLPEVRSEKIKDLKRILSYVETELKSLRADPGLHISVAAQSYMKQQEDFLQEEEVSLQQTQEVLQSDNLQIKSKNKKPVAK